MTRTSTTLERRPPSNSPSPPRRLPRSRSSSPSRQLSGWRSRSPSAARGRLPTSTSQPQRCRSRSWSPSYSLSAPPPPPQAKKGTLYIFLEHAQGCVRHSLYAVEIPDPLPPIPSKQSLKYQLYNPKPLAPTLLFSRNEFSYGMCCVQLGSKFYFLGGEKQIEPPQEEVIEGKNFFFPPDVYIFEPTTSTSTSTSGKTNASDVLIQGSPMKTGKNEPIVFVAFGKIYALSGPFRKFNCFELECFEVFDPTNNTWTSLPPPPFNNFYPRTHAIVKTKVYILAAPILSTTYWIYCFDLNNNEWIPSSKLKSLTTRTSYRFYDIVEDTIYGLLDSTIVALPVKDTDEDGEFFEHQVSFSPEGPRNSYSLHPFVVRPTNFLTHLDNRRFFYVVSGNPPRPPLSVNYEDIAIDPRTRYFSVTIFDALSHTFADKYGTTKRKAKFLYDAHFVAQTPWDTSVGILRSSFFIPV